jgi:hypothetical protein
MKDSTREFKALKKIPKPPEIELLKPGYVYCPGTKGNFKIPVQACLIHQSDGWGCVKVCPNKRKKEENSGTEK